MYLVKFIKNKLSLNLKSKITDFKFQVHLNAKERDLSPLSLI